MTSISLNSQQISMRSYHNLIKEPLNSVNTMAIISFLDDLINSNEDINDINYEIEKMFSPGCIFNQKLENDQNENALMIFKKINESSFKFECYVFIEFFSNNPIFYLFYTLSIDVSNIEINILSNYLCLKKLLGYITLAMDLDALIVFVKKNKRNVEDNKLNVEKKIKDGTYESQLGACLSVFLMNLREGYYKLTDSRKVLSEYHKVYELYKCLGGKGEDNAMSFPEIKESILTLMIKKYYPLDDIFTLTHAIQDKSFKDGSGKTPLDIYLEALKNYKINNKSIFLDDKVYVIYKLLGGTGTDGIISETKTSILMYSLDVCLPIEEIRNIIKIYYSSLSYKDNNGHTAIDRFKKSSCYNEYHNKLYDIFPRLSIDQYNYKPTEYLDEIKDIELIAGTSSFYIYKNDQQHIYLFGEVHTSSNDLNCDSSLITNKIHYMPKMLKQIFKTSTDDEVLDYFQEEDIYLRHSDEERKSKDSHGYSDNTQTSSGTMQCYQPYF